MTFDCLGAVKYMQSVAIFLDRFKDKGESMNLVFGAFKSPESSHVSRIPPRNGQEHLPSINYHQSIVNQMFIMSHSKVRTLGDIISATC